MQNESGPPKKIVNLSIQIPSDDLDAIPPLGITRVGHQHQVPWDTPNLKRVRPEENDVGQAYPPSKRHHTRKKQPPTPQGGAISPYFFFNDPVQPREPILPPHLSFPAPVQQGGATPPHGFFPAPVQQGGLTPPQAGPIPPYLG